MKKNLVFPSIAIAVALFIAGFFLVDGLTRHSDPRGITSVSKVSTIDMNGTWIDQTTTSDKFTATINDGNISIDISDGDTSGLYWKGTFPVSSILADGFTVTSAGDTAAMDASLLGSQAKTKNFSYANGELSFSFSAMGMSTTIHMQRSSE